MSLEEGLLSAHAANPSDTVNPSDAMNPNPSDAMNPIDDVHPIDANANIYFTFDTETRLLNKVVEVDLPNSYIETRGGVVERVEKMSGELMFDQKIIISPSMEIFHSMKNECDCTCYKRIQVPYQRVPWEELHVLEDAYVTITRSFLSLGYRENFETVLGTLTGILGPIVSTVQSGGDIFAIVINILLIARFYWNRSLLQRFIKEMTDNFHSIVSPDYRELNSNVAQQQLGPSECLKIVVVRCRLIVYSTRIDLEGTGSKRIIETKPCTLVRVFEIPENDYIGGVKSPYTFTKNNAWFNLFSYLRFILIFVNVWFALTFWAAAQHDNNEK